MLVGLVLAREIGERGKGKVYNDARIRGWFL